MYVHVPGLIASSDSVLIGPFPNYYTKLLFDSSQWHYGYYSRSHLLQGKMVSSAIPQGLTCFTEYNLSGYRILQASSAPTICLDLKRKAGKENKLDNLFRTKPRNVRNKIQ